MESRGIVTWPRILCWLRSISPAASLVAPLASHMPRTRAARRTCPASRWRRCGRRRAAQRRRACATSRRRRCDRLRAPSPGDLRELRRASVPAPSSSPEQIRRNVDPWPRARPPTPEGAPGLQAVPRGAAGAVYARRAVRAAPARAGGRPLGLGALLDRAVSRRVRVAGSSDAADDAGTFTPSNCRPGAGRRRRCRGRLLGAMQPAARRPRARGVGPGVRAPLCQRDSSRNAAPRRGRRRASRSVRRRRRTAALGHSAVFEAERGRPGRRTPTQRGASGERGTRG